MTNLSTTIPANEARANFYQILDRVGEKLEQFTITLRGDTRAVIMSAEEFANWQETLEILSDKKLVQSIRKGLKSKRKYSQKDVSKIIGW